MSHGGVVSGYSTLTSLSRVDGLSMNPRDLGRHTIQVLGLYHLVGSRVVLI